MKKKVLYIITKSNWGGAQKYVYDLCVALDKNQYEPVVVLGSPHADEQASGTLLKKLEESKIRTIEIPEMQRNISLAKEWVVFWKLFSIIAHEKPGIVHVNSSKAGGLGALATRILNLLFLIPNSRIIFTAHGWPFLENRSPRLRRLMKLLSWLTVALSHDTIVVSRENFEIGRKMPFIKNKIKLIFNGVKQTNFYTREEAREILRKRVEEISGVSPFKECVWIGTIAEYTRNKSLDVLVHALSLLIERRRDLKVFGFLIGDGEERKILETKIHEDGMANHIFLMGFMPEAARLLQAFDIFALVSQKEGHPYTLLEAGSAGLPCIGTNISGIQDILSDNAGTLIEPNDSRELEKKLEELIINQNLRLTQGKKLQEKVESEFSFETMLQKTLALY